MIHPSAIVDRKANLHPSVQIGPFCVVEAGVTLEEGCVLTSHVVVHAGTTLKANCHVSPHAIIGGLPQVRGFKSDTPSYLIVGENSIIREGVTLHRAMMPEKATIVGKNALMMAYSHIGHDCLVGDNVTLTNAVLLAGFVEIGKNVTIGGGAAVHQKVRVGDLAMIGGLSIITYDLPPYMVTANRNMAYGLNLVGIKRQGYGQDVISDLKRAYKLVYSLSGDLAKAAAVALESGAITTPQGRHFLEFFQQGHRGTFIRPRHRPLEEKEAE